KLNFWNLQQNQDVNINSTTKTNINKAYDVEFDEYLLIQGQYDIEILPEISIIYVYESIPVVSSTITNIPYAVTVKSNSELVTNRMIVLPRPELHNLQAHLSIN
ncbi:MAG: hypothetical protein AAGK97_12375, partial [Bacteroidota bacterium]